MTDFGYFGPGSVTWRVHAEPLTMVGGLRALLVQALHPEAMRLLYQRSSFQDDPWSRLQATVIYVATVSFGTTAEADAAAALAWVHACEVDSFLVAARYAGVRISADDADRYVTEQSRAARLVGVPDELAPRTARDLAAYFTATRPRLRLTREAREAARVVIAPPLPVPPRWALPARAGWTLLVTLAVGLLPAWARRMYGLPPVPGTGIATHGGMRATQSVVAALPETWRHGPHYRRAMARAQSTKAEPSATPSPPQGSTSGDAA
jgi:uncharacterized protein (DUF2236 family)